MLGAQEDEFLTRDSSDSGTGRRNNVFVRNTAKSSLKFTPLYAWDIFASDDGCRCEGKLHNSRRSLCARLRTEQTLREAGDHLLFGWVLDFCCWWSALHLV